MDAKLLFTAEAKKVFNYIKNPVAERFNITKIPVEAFILAVCENPDCKAYTILDTQMKGAEKEGLVSWCIGRLLPDTKESDSLPYYDTNYDKAAEWYKTHIGETISTDWFLYSVLCTNIAVMDKFMELGIYPDNVEFSITGKSVGSIETHLKPVEDGGKPSDEEISELEMYCPSMTDLGRDDYTDDIMYCDNVITQTLAILQKSYNNNVVLVGGYGSGRTSTVFNIANLMEDGKVPYPLKGRSIRLCDIWKIASTCVAYGDFYNNIRKVFLGARDDASVILFFDDVEKFFENPVRVSDEPMASILYIALKDPQIQCIITTTPEGFDTHFKKDESLCSIVSRIDMPILTTEQTTNVVKKKSARLEELHRTTIPDEIITKAVQYSEKVSDIGAASRALDYLDTACSIDVSKSDLYKSVDDSLAHAMDIATEILNTPEDTKKGKARRNKLTKELEKLNAKQEELLTEIYMSDRRIVVTEEALQSAVEKTENSILYTEKLHNNLKKLNGALLDKVVGQDDIIATLTRSVIRKTMGISDPLKPYTTMFVGSTGCGKTYLAKCLARELFGSENKLVRLDMSEYADSTSVTKLYGSSAGYVGYSNGGILTEAVKKHKQCIILLDEIEKADKGVFDAFLQIFDEGRMTDNQGVTVDFSKCVIIMTSNVGTDDIAKAGHTIGFNNTNENIRNKDIIKKAIQKTFRPEFINRVDDVLYFNQLTDDNLRSIIRKELKISMERVESLGYEIDDDIYSNAVVDIIFDEAQGERAYGARPVKRSIQTNIEDIFASFILNNEPPNGYRLSWKEISEWQSAGK